MLFIVLIENEIEIKIVELFWCASVSYECECSLFISTNQICACVKDNNRINIILFHFILFYSCNKFWDFTFWHSVENSTNYQLFHIPHMQKLWFSRSDNTQARELGVHYYDYILVFASNATDAATVAAFVIVQTLSIPFSWLSCLCACVFCVNVCILHIFVRACTINPWRFFRVLSCLS